MSAPELDLPHDRGVFSRPLTAPEPTPNAASQTATPTWNGLDPNAPVDMDALLAHLRSIGPADQPVPDPSSDDETPATEPSRTPELAAAVVLGELVTAHVNPFDAPIHEGPLKGHDPAEWAECCVPPWAELPETGQRPAPVTAAVDDDDPFGIDVNYSADDYDAPDPQSGDPAPGDSGPTNSGPGEPAAAVRQDTEPPNTDPAPSADPGPVADLDDDPFGFRTPAAAPGAQPVDGPWSGLTVLVTGEVPGLTRSAAQQAITALGAKTTGSVGAKTSLAVLGDGAGLSKLSKIAFHKTPVMSAADFLALRRKHAAGDPCPGPFGISLAEYEARVAATEANEVPVDRGSLAAWFGDAPDPVEPDAHLPMQQQHLVTMVVVYPLHNGRPHREIRMSCDCGHRWLGESLHAGMKCPNRHIERPAPTEAVSGTGTEPGAEAA